MKKIITAIVAVLVLVPMFAMSVWAAEAPEMSAKKGAATVDGVINDGEYGDAFVVSGENAISWTKGELDSEISYYFAWTEEALYVASSVPSADIESGLTVQLNFNPGNLIPDDLSGLFFGMSYLGNDKIQVTQHNHGTKLQETLGEALTADITEKVEAVAKNDGTNVVLEVAIPVDFFKIISIEDVSFDEFALSADAVLTASPFMVFNGHGFTVTGIDSIPENHSWAVGDFGLGKINLLNADETKPSENPSESTNPTTKPTQKPDDNGNPSTFDLGIVSLAAVALSSVVAVKKRK